MALTDTSSAAPFSLFKLLAAPFRAIESGMISIMESNSRIQQVDRLQSMSDAQLAARGIKRDEIVQYVFRAHMHV